MLDSSGGSDDERLRSTPGCARARLICARGPHVYRPHVYRRNHVIQWHAVQCIRFSLLSRTQAAAFLRLYSASEILFLPLGLVGPVREEPELAPVVPRLGRSIFNSFKLMLA